MATRSASLGIQFAAVVVAVVGVSIIPTHRRVVSVDSSKILGLPSLGDYEEDLYSASMPHGRLGRFRQCVFDVGGHLFTVESSCGFGDQGAKERVEFKHQEVLDPETIGLGDESFRGDGLGLDRLTFRRGNVTISLDGNDRGQDPLERASRLEMAKRLDQAIVARADGVTVAGTPFYRVFWAFCLQDGYNALRRKAGDLWSALAHK
jgi:hypothetical protein